MDNKLTLPDKAKPLVNGLRELFDFCQEKLVGNSINTDDNYINYYLLFFTDFVLKSIDSVLTLVENNSFYCIDIFLRPMIEGLINYQYIKNDKTQIRAKAYIMSDHGDRIRQINKILLIKDNNTKKLFLEKLGEKKLVCLKDKLVREKKDFENKYGKESKFPDSLINRAIKSNTVGLYLTVYWLLSQDSHFTPRAMEKYLNEKDSGYEITGDIDLNNFLISLKTYCILLESLIDECNIYFNVPKKKEIVVLKAKLSKLYVAQ